MRGPGSRNTRAFVSRVRVRLLLPLGGEGRDEGVAPYRKQRLLQEGSACPLTPTLSPDGGEGEVRGAVSGCAPLGLPPGRIQGRSADSFVRVFVALSRIRAEKAVRAPETLTAHRRCPSHRNSTGTRKPRPNESHTSHRWRIERNASMTPSTIVTMSATAIVTTNTRNSQGE